MLLIPTLFIVATTPIMTVGEKCKSSFGDVSNQTNNTSLLTNSSYAWAETDKPDCENHTWVRKCCEDDKVFSYDKFACVEPLPGEQRFEVAFKTIDARSTESANPVLLLAGFP